MTWRHRSLPWCRKWSRGSGCIGCPGSSRPRRVLSRSADTPCLDLGPDSRNTRLKTTAFNVATKLQFRNLFWRELCVTVQKPSINGRISHKTCCGIHSSDLYTNGNRTHRWCNQSWIDTCIPQAKVRWWIVSCILLWFFSSFPRRRPARWWWFCRHLLRPCTPWRWMSWSEWRMLFWTTVSCARKKTSFF